MSGQEQVLVDPVLDRALRQHGFVTIPLIGRDSAISLAERFDTEFDELRTPVETGIHADLDVPDPDFRRRTLGAISDALAGVTTELFINHELFLCNFLKKWPGPETDQYLHRDWMYVDERQGHRTYTVWVPLVDVLGHNGQLRVLRGSHHIDQMLRGSGLMAEWLEHTEVIEPRLLDVPVAAGYAVIFDNAIAHCSYPNHTDDPRLAVGLAFHRTGEQLVHFRRLDEHRAEKYLVDREFFLTCNPRTLAADPPLYPVTDQVEIEPVSLPPAELAHLLNRGFLAKAEFVRSRVRRSADDVLGRSREAVNRRKRSIDVWANRIRPDPSQRMPRRKNLIRPALERSREFAVSLPSLAAMRVLRANEWLIDRAGPRTPAVWDHHEFEWSHRIEDGWKSVRAEVDRLLLGPTDIPHIEDVTGGIPQGNEGPWRTFVLMHQGRWIDWNCERCPMTTELVRSIPGLTMAGFSVLEPGTHITEHRGPNKGALRYQLGVIVPGDEGACRIRVGDRMLHWHEGEGVMFDFTVPHEAWNDSEGIRVLLMLEVITPLPWYLAPTNRLAQHAMGWFPTTRDIKTRLRRLEPSLQRA